MKTQILNLIPILILILIIISCNNENKLFKDLLNELDKVIITHNFSDSRAIEITDKNQLDLFKDNIIHSKKEPIKYRSNYIIMFKDDKKIEHKLLINNQYFKFERKTYKMNLSIQEIFPVLETYSFDIDNKIDNTEKQDSSINNYMNFVDSLVNNQLTYYDTIEYNYTEKIHYDTLNKIEEFIIDNKKIKNFIYKKKEFCAIFDSLECFGNCNYHLYEKINNNTFIKIAKLEGIDFEIINNQKENPIINVTMKLGGGKYLISYYEYNINKSYFLCQKTESYDGFKNAEIPYRVSYYKYK